MKVLITVTTYPLPSRSYDELVCTAGVLENGAWIRIYPVPLKFLRGLRENGSLKSYKYTWIELELKKRKDDFRPESYSPEDYSFKDLKIHSELGTENNWIKRKEFCLKHFYTDLNELLNDSKAPKNISLATFKPVKILDFIIEPDEREWKTEWQEQIRQLQINFGEDIKTEPRVLIPKIPYKYYYKFEDTKGRISKMMIEDWEIGALYWNCLKDSQQNEDEALRKVKSKFFDDFTKNKDLYLFLGTTKAWHARRTKNPFVIVGVFYPPKDTNPQLRINF